MELDFKGIDKKEAILKFDELLEEAQEQQESFDVTIITGDNYHVSGAILEYIDELDLEHQIELGGVIRVTIE